MYSFCLVGMETKERSITVSLNCDSEALLAETMATGALYSAMVLDNIALAKEMLTLNPCAVNTSLIEHCSDDTVNLLHLAPNREWAKLLVKYGAQIDQKSSKGLTPLDCACLRGSGFYDSHLDYLIRHGADVNNVDASGNSLLHRIIQTNNNLTPKLISILLRNGVDINKRNNEGQTPFDVAVFTYNSEIIQCFEKVGIFFIPALGKISPIRLLKHKACKLKGIESLAFFSIFRRAPLNCLAKFFMFIKQCEERQQRTKNIPLLSDGIIINSYGCCLKNCSFKDLEQLVGKNAIQYAKKCLSSVCIQSYQQLENKDDCSFTAHIIAYPFAVSYDTKIRNKLCKYMINHLCDNIIASSYLLNRIDDINFVDSKGNNLLHRAVLANNTTLLNFMVTDAFNPIIDFTKKNKVGLTPLGLAKRDKNSACIEILYKGLGAKLGRIPKHDPLRKKVVHFLNKECDVHYRRIQKGKTLLFKIATHFCSGTYWASLLLKKGARINITDNSKEPILGRTIKKLNTLIRLGFPEKEDLPMLLLLLQNGALVTKKMLSQCCNSRNVQEILQEAYDKQECCVCYENYAIMGDIPCSNMHRGSFLCSACYTCIKDRNNGCPFNCGQLNDDYCPLEIA